MRSSIDRCRTWILRGGTLALLLSSAAPGAAAPSREYIEPDPSAQAAADRAPTWAPATLVGEVLVTTDRLGRLAVVVDEALGGRTSRGAATRMFLLTTETPVTDAVHVRLGLASVLFRGGSLVVTTPSGRYTVDLALRSQSDGRRSVQDDGIVLHDGIALQSLRLAGPSLPVEAVAIDDRPSAVLEEAGSVVAADACQAGGDGATTCTKKCSMGGASISFIDECSVTCTAGYHACCNCIIPSQGATCTCVKDVFIGPKQPGAVRLDRN
jgi:hypothetical protein